MSMQDEDSLSNLFDSEEPQSSRKYFDLETAPTSIKQEIDEEHIKLEITDTDPLDPLGLDDQVGTDDDMDADTVDDERFQRQNRQVVRTKKRKRKQKKFYFTSDMNERREVERLKRRIKFLEKKLDDKEEEIQQWMLLTMVAIIKLRRR